MKLLYKYYLMIALPLVTCLFVIGIGLSFQMHNYSIAEKHTSLERAARRVSTMTEELYYNPSPQLQAQTLLGIESQDMVVLMEVKVDVKEELVILQRLVMAMMM